MSSMFFMRQGFRGPGVQGSRALISLIPLIPLIPLIR